jgi:glycosyltransferase involved in cell wall biosynthesis
LQEFSKSKIKMKDVILIVSRDASRTGAPILLLNSLKWIKKNSGLKFVLLFSEGGELLPDFKLIGDVHLWSDVVTGGFKNNKNRYLLFRILKRIFGFSEKLICKFYFSKLKKQYNIRLIFSNTSTNGSIISYLKNFISSKIIVYVHEGDRILENFNNQGFVSYSLNTADRILTVSSSVKETLTKKYSIRGKIEVIPGGIDTGYSFKVNSRSLLKQEKITDNSVILMSCGWLDLNKGADFFIQIARILTLKNEKIHFIWLGGDSNDPIYKYLEYDIKKMNLSQRVTLLPSRDNAIDYINMADIFLMLSREESFSLVTIEAGLAHKPVLCFEDSGGPIEIVDNDPRFIVPYADINKMSERIEYLINNENERLNMGKFLYQRVINNYTIEKNGSSILAVMNNEINNF